MERVVRGSSRSFHRGSVSTVPRRSRGMTPTASGRREFHVLTRALILSGRFAVEMCDDLDYLTESSSHEIRAEVRFS